MAKKARREQSLESRAFFFLLKAAVVVFALLLPLLGAWTASSLAAYGNGPRWLAMAVGLLGFPILPLAWEGFAQYRRTKAFYKKPHILTFSDRLWMRTLAINLLFVTLLFWLRPESGVRALSARGDFLLDGVSAPWADATRCGLHHVADAFDWIYRAAHENPYEDTDQGTKQKKATKDDGVPPPVRRGEEKELSQEGQDGKNGNKTDDGKKPPLPVPTPKAEEPAPAPLPGQLWPLADRPLAAALEVPEASLATPETVGVYMAKTFPDDVTRARAIHDFVADRTAYDVHSMRVKAERAPQDANTVFTRHMGVCEGFARLYLAIAKAAGLEAQYILGDAKGEGGQVDGNGHAWNAVKAGGAWRLVDVTWDAGPVNNDVFQKKYGTEYLFTPPEMFGLDHFPKEPTWQLRNPAISRGDFMRTPELRPRFMGTGARLLRPDHSQVTVQASFDAAVAKPPAGTFFMLADWVNGEKRERCQVTDGAEIGIHCNLPAAGSYRVLLFHSTQRYGRYEYSGELNVQDSR